MIAMYFRHFTVSFFFLNKIKIRKIQDKQCCIFSWIFFLFQDKRHLTYQSHFVIHQVDFMNNFKKYFSEKNPIIHQPRLSRIPTMLYLFIFLFYSIFPENNSTWNFIFIFRSSSFTFQVIK